MGVGACQPAQSRPAEPQAVVGCCWGGGERVFVHVLILEGHQTGVGAAAHILSQYGRVCHFSTDGVGFLRPTEGRKNNNTLAIGPRLFAKCFHSWYFL